MSLGTSSRPFHWSIGKELHSHLGVQKDEENPKRNGQTHLESLKEGVDGLVSKNLGNDGVSGHPCYKLSLRQLVVLVPENYVISFDSFELSLC